MLGEHINSYDATPQYCKRTKARHIMLLIFTQTPTPTSQTIPP
jgi:hypothetical protein